MRLGFLTAPFPETPLMEVADWAAANDSQASEIVAQIAAKGLAISGLISAAADLRLGPIRDELQRRVKTTSLDKVEIVAAELGTWAGAIGAAIHGAESVA